MENDRGRNSGRGEVMRGFQNAGKGGLLLAAAGLILMGFGILRGEMSVVLAKAINICLECIGIG